MTNLNKKIDELENELKLLKNEIQQCLLDIREHVLTDYPPTTKCKPGSKPVESINEDFPSDKGEIPIQKEQQQQLRTIDEHHWPEGNDAIRITKPTHSGNAPTLQYSSYTTGTIPLPPSQRSKAFVTFSKGQTGPQIVAPSQPYNRMQSLPPDQSYGPILSFPPTEFHEQLQSPRQKQSQRRGISSHQKQFHRGDIRPPFRSHHLESLEVSKADLMRDLRDAVMASSFDEDSHWPIEQTNGKKLMHERYDPPQYPNLELDTIARITHWVSNGVQSIGRERMEVVVDMYNMTGNLSSKARDTILKLIRFSEEEEPGGNIPISDCIPIMMQLNSILISEKDSTEPPSI
ncbi:MAG: hypothetical protein SVY53_09230 [Chloroflexota bacterium]|nr:hypothetical protein [Chloroflexota bacterium]